ncbi:PREDICTED: epididymal secretory protein E1 isoform X2 [Drosophila arizonae]|uniref:Epididymal secretory protein E1 isoform X2 n=1 Tax=Drosophila arizonae TaxID=7263 RepID=A0ABM1Q1M4_DROAR|nr:PREDICTED: epididymal secretory protein E1 isoform X2 [Drosophila arizonae]
MFRIAFLTLAYLCITCGATPVKECKNKPAPLNVDIKDCPEPPCVVYKGQFAIMDVQFLGDKNNIASITAKVQAKVFGMNLPYDLPEEISNVCINLLYGAMCPIYKDEDVTYRFNFYVDPLFPEITADVTVTLNDADDNPISCFIVSCKLRKGPSSRLELEAIDGDTLIE